MNISSRRQPVSFAALVSLFVASTLALVPAEARASTNYVAEAAGIQSDGTLAFAGRSSDPVDSTVGDAVVGANDLLTLGSRVDQAHDVVVLADDSYLVAGESRGSSGGADFLLARFHADGTLDGTFASTPSTSGATTTDFTGYDDRAHAIAVQSDGKVILAGESSRSGGSPDFALARYNEDGTLDSSFGSAGNGKVTYSFSSYSNDVALDVVVASDDSIIIAGHSGGDFALAKFTSEGSIDTSSNFGDSGEVSTAFSSGFTDRSEIRALALQADGRINAGGMAKIGSDRVFAAARYTSEGVLDPSFGAGGKQTIDFGGAVDEARALAIEPLGNIILAGGTETTLGAGSGTYERFAIARLTPWGQIDPLFGNGGRQITPFPCDSLNWCETARAHDVLVIANQIVASGEATEIDEKTKLSTHNRTVAAASYDLSGNLLSADTVHMAGKVPQDWTAPPLDIKFAATEGIVGQAMAAQPIVRNLRPGESVEYSIAPAPRSDLSFHTATGVLSGTPSDLGASSGAPFKNKTTTYTVSASTSLGRTDTADLVLTVHPLDSDSDSIPDSWESQAVDTNNDGTPDLNLPAMGADPNHKDIFVEIDSMPGKRLAQSAVDDVIEAFDRAPVANLDNETGIHLHVDNGPDSSLGPDDDQTWQDAGGSKSTDDIDDSDPVLDGDPWSQFDALSELSPERSKVFHYALSVGEIPGGYGISRSGGGEEGPSADFIVAIGGDDCVDAHCVRVGRGPEGFQANILMHELGHNLGLGHGGDESLRDKKPNYPSVMNRLFNFAFAELTNEMDYSRYDERDGLLQLDEEHLDEHAGFGNTVAPLAAQPTYVYCEDWWDAVTGGQWQTRSLTSGIDFNCNGGDLESSVDEDINEDGAKTALTPFNDWDNIRYDGVQTRGASTSSFGNASARQASWDQEPTFREAMREAQEIAPGPTLDPPTTSVLADGTARIAIDVRTFSQPAAVRLKCKEGDDVLKTKAQVVKKQRSARLVFSADLSAHHKQRCRVFARTRVYDSRTAPFVIEAPAFSGEG